MVVPRYSGPSFLFIGIGVVIGFFGSFFFDLSEYRKSIDLYAFRPIKDNAHSHADPHSHEEVDDVDGPKKAMHFHENDTNPHKGLRTLFLCLKIFKRNHSLKNDTVFR